MKTLENFFICSKRDLKYLKHEDQLMKNWWKFISRAYRFEMSANVRWMRKGVEMECSKIIETACEWISAVFVLLDEAERN